MTKKTEEAIDIIKEIVDEYLKYGNKIKFNAFSRAILFLEKEGILKVIPLQNRNDFVEYAIVGQKETYTLRISYEQKQDP